MNLISERWIPVRRADGSRAKIAPWQITDHVGTNTSPIVAIASPRPDFDGALVQFLIGLLQTTCTPPDKKTWRKWRREPPSSQELKARFNRYEKAFNISGDKGPIFMQERLIDSGKGKPHPVSYLLIGSPTDSTVKQNIDHFQKRPKEDEYLCSRCAASALYTLQTFAPSGGGGGEGKFTSIRGGGPLTTLLLGNTLWETVWINIVLGEPFVISEPSSKTFPWLDITSFLDQKASVKVIHSDDMNPEHVFWGMPRRINLEFTNSIDSKSCAVCGEIIKKVCARYFDKDGGLTYQQKVGSTKKSSWIYPLHPLTPYTERDDKRPNAVHPQSGGIGYRHWLGLIENSTEGNTTRKPAKVVDQFRNLAPEDGRLWAFGYDMDNMKACCWYDSTMPIYYMEDSDKAAFLSARLADMVKAARYVSGLIMSAVLRATMLDAKKQKDGKR